jgi:hypothetical protein
LPFNDACDEAACVLQNMLQDPLQAAQQQQLLLLLELCLLQPFVVLSSQQQALEQAFQAVLL